MTTAVATPLQAKGGAFLIEDRAPNEIFTAEDLNEEHLAIARTVDQFWTNDVEPHLEEIRQQKPGVALKVLRKAAELGLAAIPIPEKFGGMEMDLPSVMIVSEHLAKDASYGSWHSSHTASERFLFSFLATKNRSESIFLSWRRLSCWPHTR